MTLEQIIAEYDLNGFWLEGGGTDKNTDHSYCPYYNQLFDSYRDRPADILEIGCWQGAFVLAMSKLMPQARFTTIDIQDKFHQRILSMMPPGTVVNHQLVNAYAFSTLKLIEGQQFDVIIDDGSHLIQDELFVFYHYMPFVKPGGALIIEDISEETVKIVSAHIDPSLYAYKVVDVRWVKGRADDMIIEIRKK